MICDSVHREYEQYGELSSQTENVPEFLSGMVILAMGLHLYGSYHEFRERYTSR